MSHACPKCSALCYCGDDIDGYAFESTIDPDRCTHCMERQKAFSMQKINLPGFIEVTIQLQPPHLYAPTKVTLHYSKIHFENGQGFWSSRTTRKVLESPEEIEKLVRENLRMWGNQ